MRGRAWVWPVGLVAVLGAAVLANVILFVTANRDASFAIEPDYYRKALAWDEKLAQDQRNTALGWRLACELVAEGTRGELVVRLAERDGQPLGGAKVRAVAFHRARGAERRTLTLREVAPGTYGARVEPVRPGLWQLEVEVVRGGARFVQVAGVELGAAGSGRGSGARSERRSGSGLAKATGAR
ncbi:MAG: FixH family protein [Deltaproteobacteria bacterium]|nr:FixH family protein [Deltaproteobacteria bacterium]